MAAHASAAGLAPDAGFAVFTRLVPSRRAARLDLGLHGAIVLALGIAAAVWLPQASGAIMLLSIAVALVSWRRRVHRSMAGYRHLHISADGVWSLAPLARLDQPDRLLPDVLTRSPLGCVSVRGPCSGPATQTVSSTNVVLWSDSMSADAWRRLQICVARSAQFHAEGQ
ncbi:hypothetical protein FXN63_14710 [Pigmentiphaga aceris]|uniref:Uncharacterized protein n=1 Tax=Pigmentiphaga aceris TaxID=1940612 RepID=A0A5C0AX74_9BURK|nr:protein YgfX [Pigmentiphaga aceris]QEI06948.1 hypothetical protein FXN63_14710 [Pigmentiphaga aceris]